MEEDTRQRLLDAAEALFAEHGLISTSLRAITTQAGANLAAVHYHFGSKDALIRAVLMRRLDPLNAERCRRLEVLDALGEAVSVERALAAFISPALDLRGAGVAGERFTCLLGRVQLEGDEGLRCFMRERYAPVMERLQAVLARTLPELPAEELRWRLHFTLGVLSFTYASLAPRVPVTALDAEDGQWLQEQLIQFLAAGLRAFSVVARAPALLY